MAAGCSADCCSVPNSFVLQHNNCSPVSYIHLDPDAGGDHQTSILIRNPNRSKSIRRLLYRLDFLSPHVICQHIIAIKHFYKDSILPCSIQCFKKMNDWYIFWASIESAMLQGPSHPPNCCCRSSVIHRTQAD